MSYLLDTNVCIALMRGSESNVTREFRRAIMAKRTVSISSVVLFELEYGVQRSAHVAANHARLQTFLSLHIEVLPLLAEDAFAAARIRAELERRKQPIGPFDTLIAGQAAARGMTLVTANVREFARVKGLRWEDWAK